MVTHKVVIRPAAKRDLEAIAIYTKQQWGMRQARRYVAALRSASTSNRSLIFQCVTRYTAAAMEWNFASYRADIIWCFIQSTKARCRLRASFTNAWISTGTSSGRDRKRIGAGSCLISIIPPQL